MSSHVSGNGGENLPATPRLSRHQQLNKLYALPAPLRTFPLPTLVPHNPVSLFHILYVWLSYTLKPQPSQPEKLLQGWFSLETRSVHVIDGRSIRALWEQGFYGKGSLSRSEPSWLEREKTRKGSRAKKTSEEVTRQRRAERQQTKWERARKEREAIDQKLLEEAEAALVEERRKLDTFSNVEVSDEYIHPVRESCHEVEPSVRREMKSPTSPAEILALPNSDSELEQQLLEAQVEVANTVKDSHRIVSNRFDSAPVGPLELLALPNTLKLAGVIGDLDNFRSQSSIPPSASGYVDSTREPMSVEASRSGQTVGRGIFSEDLMKIAEAEVIGGSETNEDTAGSSTHSDDTVETSTTAPQIPALTNGSSLIPHMKRRKSVRFSPTVEKNTFIQTEPPSPEHGTSTVKIEEQPLSIKQQEHTQLTLEEAFFLSYGLGVLEVLHPETELPISNRELFSLFRKTSYFPPVANQSFSPDDPFLINYVVYHHFRSLGWVPRSGVKFSVDLMLYVRGPVFTHAEFAVLILPSYSSPYWSGDVFLQKYVKAKEQRTWAGISCINRVVTQVKKTLILAYVDIPPPLDKVREGKMGIDEILNRYKVREIVMKRWIANRSRD